MSTLPPVTIAIKAFNSASTMHDCVKSALEALRRAGGGEVLAMDLASSDGTGGIAAESGARIVRLTDPAQRSWGVGPAIAFESAQHDFVYILDADMEMNPDFLYEALPLFDDPAIVAVGGRIEEAPSDHPVSKLYARKLLREASPTVVNARMLEGGGLYHRLRCQALGEVPNAAIISNEEAEFGFRLAKKGGRLLRIPLLAATHRPARPAGLREFRVKWDSGYYHGPGQVLRASLRHGVFAAHLVRLRLYAAVLGWLAMGLAALTLLAWTIRPIAGWLGLTALFVLVRLITRGRLGLYSLVSWVYGAVGLVGGAFMPARPFHPATSAEKSG